MKKLFIDKELTQPILDWVLVRENREKYFPRLPKTEPDYMRSHNFFEEHKPIIDSMGLNFDDIVKIDKQILIHYELHPQTPLDDEFGYLLSWQEKGKEVKPHRDANKKGKINVRFNMLLKKPKKGGLPIISDKVLRVKENEVWVCLAGLNKHGTTLIESKDGRVLLSIGHYVDEAVVKEKGWMHPDCKGVEESPMWNRSSTYNEDKYYPYSNLQQRNQLRGITEKEKEQLAKETMEMILEFWDEETPESVRVQIASRLGYQYPTQEDEEPIS